jgi:flagellar biosynthesis protein FliP
MRTDSLLAHLRGAIFLVLVLCIPAVSAHAQEITGDLPGDVRAPLPPLSSPGSSGSLSPGTSAPQTPTFQIPDMTKRENFSAAMQIIILLTVLSLAPAILIMMTSFTRIVIVLSLLRQAIGTQQLPPNQILIGLSMFMTFLVMAPTWTKVNEQALQPYMTGQIEQKEALSRALLPVREFMEGQIINCGNDSDVFMMQAFATGKTPQTLTWSEVSTTTLIPSFMLSELKTAFLMGFKIYLPFLIIDVVISTVLISMGMMMLPPVLISLPFKLLLFVLVDGWHLITESLISSFSA